MTLKHKLQAVALLLITITSGNAQLWVENYQFGAPGFDAEKWTVRSDYRMSFDASSLNIGRNLNYDGTFQGFEFPSFTWKQSLPLNQSWSVVLRLSFNEVENPNYLETMRASYGDNSASTSIGQYSGTIRNQPPFPSPPDITINGYDVDVPLNTFVWWGLSYDYEARNLCGVFSLSSNTETPPIESFQRKGGGISTIGSENAEVSIFNQVSLISNADIKTTNFNIIPYSVPEPSALSLLAVGLGGLVLLRRKM
jgi:hypothetical protein